MSETTTNAFALMSEEYDRLIAEGIGPEQALFHIMDTFTESAAGDWWLARTDENFEWYRQQPTTPTTPGQPEKITLPKSHGGQK